MPSTTSQEDFLGNARNKVQLISILSAKLKDANMDVRQAIGDADNLIVSTALSKSLESSSVIVVANDTDILVALIALADNNNSLCVLQPANVKTPLKVFNIQQLQTTLGNVKDVILFLYAATGSDTTCAIFGKGKKLAYKVLKSNPELCRKVKLFYQSLAARDDIASIREELLLALYSSKGATTQMSCGTSCTAKVSAQNRKERVH